MNFTFYSSSSLRPKTRTEIEQVTKEGRKRKEC